MKPCDAVRERLQEHLDGRLLPLDQASVQVHLEHCVACRGEAASWGELFVALDDLPEADVPAGFADSVMQDLPEMLPAEEGPGHVLRWGIVVVAALSAFVASLALFLNESGPDVARETLEPLAASLQLGGLLLAQVGLGMAAALHAMSEAMASASLAAKVAFVVTFAAVNAALLALVARLRPAHDVGRPRR